MAPHLVDLKADHLADHWEHLKAVQKAGSKVAKRVDLMAVPRVGSKAGSMAG